jgi:hypothetical protein
VNLRILYGNAARTPALNRKWRRLTCDQLIKGIKALACIVSLRGPGAGSSTPALARAASVILTLRVHLIWPSNPRRVAVAQLLALLLY